MTIEEAREQLEDLIRDRQSFIVGDSDEEIYRKDIEALKKALELFEKQMPKNPKRGVCPSCGSRHIYAATLMKAECFKFCGNCGQALDWSEKI